MDPFADPVVVIVATVLPVLVAGVTLAVAMAIASMFPPHPDKAWWCWQAVIGVTVAFYGRWIGAF